MRKKSMKRILCWLLAIALVSGLLPTAAAENQAVVQAAVPAPAAGTQTGPESAGQSAPESAGQSAPESAGQSAPESAGQSAPESAGQSAPESAGQSAPESAGQSAPESAEQVVSELVPQNNTPDRTSNGTATLTVVGPAGNQYGTAGEAVVHPLSRFLVTGEYSGTELNLLNGDGSTTHVGYIDKETGLSAALCRLGGFSKLVEGQQYTFILGSLISEEARLTVTYQSDFPSDGLTVRNFTATPSDSGDLMVDLSWDHPEAIPDGNSTWYYSLSAFAPGSSSVTLYQKQDGRVTFGKSISVTGQRSATVATDPALGPVTFVLTVSPSGNSSYSVRSSTPGPNPSSFTETTRPTVSIYTDSLSGLTYTVQAQVTDSWGTPSYAQFTLQQKDGEGYTSTAVTGRSYVRSASFNGSGITSLMKLNLSGLGAGTYRLMAVGYDTCGNASEPAYGDEFSLDGTETGYPLLTGLRATGTSTGVTVDASALAFSDAAIAQIWEKVQELNGAYNAPATEEQLRAALNDLLKTQNVRYLLTYYTYGTSPVTQQRNVPANAEDWDYTFPVGLTFSSGYPRIAANLSLNSIQPGSQYNFEVSLSFGGVDGYATSSGSYSWGRQIGLDNWCVSAPALGGMRTDDTTPPSAGEIQGENLVGEGTFDSGASFSVTASDDVMLRGGQFSWRKTGTDQWNASVNAGAQAGAGNDVVFTVSASSLFGGNLTQNEHYDIRFLGTDWAGNSVERILTSLKYGTLDAPAHISVAVEENEATVTWDAVPGAASYRVYVNGTAQYPNVTDTSYVYYMQPCATNTPDYLKKQYTFTVAAVTSAGGEGARITSDPVTSQPDVTPPSVSQVTNQYDDGAYTFTITGYDNGQVSNYSWQLLPAEGAGNAALLEGAKTRVAFGSVHGNSTAYEWLDTKDVLNHTKGGYGTTYGVRTFPGDTPDPAYFTLNQDNSTYTLKDGSYRLRVVLYDSAGNASDACDHTFEVANVGPALPDDFVHSAAVTLSGQLSVTYSWENAPDSPGIRLWCPGRDNGYDTAAERDEMVRQLRESGDLSPLPDTPGFTGQYSIINVPVEDGTSYTSRALSSGKYYLYVITAYNAYGSIGDFQVGTFDTCFEGKPLEVVSATYNNVDITKKENNRELEQGNTLSVTVTADFIRGGSAVLCRELNGSEVQLSRYNQGSFTLQEDGRYTATLTCNIPANDFKWSGPQNVYVRLSTSGYTHIRTEDIPVGLKVIPDTEKPVLSGVSPNFGAGISGNAEFTLTATDNSGYVTQAKVEQSPYTGADNWTQITEGVAWDAGRLTLDTTKLTADITGNIKLRFTVADAAGNWSDPISGSYALANSPIPSPTGLSVTAGARLLTLTWDNVQRLDTAGYRIFRAEDNGDYVLVGTAGENQNTFTDNNNGGYLDPTKAYSYKVAAYSDAGVEGAKSVATNWLHPDEQSGAPSILSLEPWQGSAFRSPVTVTAKVEEDISVTSVKLEFAYLGKSSTAEPDSLTVWQEIRTFTDPAPDTDAGSIYTLSADWTLETGFIQTEGWFAIRVTARNNSDKTAVSTVKCRYDNKAPDPVTALSADDEGSGGAILLTFTASVSPDVQKYRVYRSENAGSFDEAQAAGHIGETAAEAYRDSTCVKGRTYRYWVTAIDRAGNESRAAGPVQATAGAVCDVSVTQPPVLKDSVLTIGRTATVAVTVRNAGPARAGGTLTLTADYGSGALDVGSVTFGEDGDYALLRAGETREVLFSMHAAEGTNVTLTAVFENDDAAAEDREPENNALSTDPLLLNNAPDAVWSLTDGVLACNSGETVSLTAQGSADDDGDPLTYAWDIGGEGKAGMAVSHRFMTPGSFPVTLTVTDAKGAATVLSGTITVADNRPDLYVVSVTAERRGAEEEDYTPVTGDDQIQEGDSVRVTAVIGNKEEAGPVPADMSFLTSLVRNGVSLGYQTLTGLEPGTTKSVTFHYTAEAGAQVLKVVTNDILQVISEPDMTNNVLTVQYDAQQVNFADIAISNLTWTDLNVAEMPTAFTTQDQVIWSATVANNGQADATFTLTLYVDGQVAAQRQVFRAKGASAVESFTIAPTAGVHTVTLTAGGELMDSDERNNSATVTTGEFTVTVPELTLSDIVIEPADAANPAQGSTLRFTVRVSSTVNITVPFSVTFQVDGKPLKSEHLDRPVESNVVLQAGQPREVFAEWVVADGSHTVTVTADPDCAVVDTPVVQTEVTRELTVLKPDLWLSDVYNAPADTLNYGGEAKFTVRVSNRSTATLFDKYALVVWAARWADNETPPPENAYEEASRTQYNGIQGNSTSIQILSFRPENSGKYSVRVGLEPMGSADFDTTYYQPYTFIYTVSDGMTLTTSPNKDGENNDFGANMFLESMIHIPVKASAAMADGRKLTAMDGLTITASILGTDNRVTLADDRTGNFSAQLPVSDLSTGNYTLHFDAVYSGYSTTYETQIVLIQDVSGSLSVTDHNTTVSAVDSADPGLQVAAGTPVEISGRLTQGDGQPYTGTIVLEMNLQPGYRDKPGGTVVEGDASAVVTWYRGQKIMFIDEETAAERSDMTYSNGKFSYTFTPRAVESGKWVVRAYAYDRLLGTDITSTAFTVYGMEPSPGETVVTMSKGSSLNTGEVELKLYNGAWDGNFGKLKNVQVTLTPKETYSGIIVNADLSGLSNVLPAGKDPLSIPLSITTYENAPDYAEYDVTFSAASNDGDDGSIDVSAKTVLKLYLRPATASPKANPGTVTVSANPGDTITRTVTVKNNGLGDWEGIAIEQPGLGFIRADNLSKDAIGQWESLTFDITFAPLPSTQLGRYLDKVVLTNKAGDVTCVIPVALEVTALDTGTATFQVTDDLGNKVEKAQIKLYGRDPQVQIINGVETEYYLNYSVTTDANGLALLEGKPAGAYDYVITAQGMETYEGVLELMPGLGGQAEAVTLATLPVQITWTVTETTIVDQYDIKLNIDMGVNIPTPKLASTSPWFTVPKQVDNLIVLTTNIVNNSLVDVYDVSAQIDYKGENNPGISVVDGGYIGTIPAMSYKTVQVMVDKGYYDLASRPSAKAALKISGSYLSYDAEGLPEMPAKTLALSVGIYNPGTSKVTVETIRKELALEEQLELSLPEDVDVSELEYLLLWDGELGTQKPENTGGTVMELVKMELSQTASLERQAFDATLTVTNNYTGNTTIQGLTANVVVERVEDGGAVTDATALMYILPQRTAPSILQPGETATLTWKLIPGEGMGGENGINYLVRADVGYTVDTPGDEEEEPVSKPVQTSTEAVEITVRPQPSLTVDYFLPHKVYPEVPFNLEVVVTNSGYGPAQNVVLDSSQLEIVENKSGLAGSWQIVGTSFGSASGTGPTTSFRVTLGDVSAGQTVKGWYTIRWELPTAAGELGDDVYGEILNFTATLTHRPYEGVELNPLITAVYTHIVGKDEVSIRDENEETQTVKVIMGDHGLPSFFWNSETNLRIPLYVPKAVSDGNLEGYSYTFTAPETAEALDTPDARHAVLMIGEVEAMTGIPVSAVYRYDNAAMTGEPVELSHGNYWKDTYKNAEGVDTDYLYIVDELKLENGQVQPRFYKVVYGSDVELKEPVTSQILYEDGERTAVLYETGRNHELGDTVPAKLAVTAVNNSGNDENVTVYFYAARCVNGSAQEYKYLGSEGPQTLQPNASADFTYSWELGLTGTNPPAIAGTYRVKMTTLGADLTAEAAANAPGVTADITFNAAPVADAGVDFSVDYGQPAVFDGTRSYDPDGGTIALYVWDFGDGQSGLGPTPSHTYRASGSYIATLYVVDDNGTENAMDMHSWEDGRPINSAAVHDVMVTVDETRPDLILVPTDGLTVTNGSSFSGGDEVALRAVITNDEEAPVTDNFIATLYVDNVYQGYERIDLFESKNGKLEQGETVTVDFTYTMPDSYSHVATVKVNDVSLLVDEADLLNNQRSIVIQGAAGVTDFPDLALSTVQVDVYTPDEKGVVRTSGNGILTLDAGRSIPITATVKNQGNLDSKATAVILYANGVYAGMDALDALAAGESRTVTIDFTPEVSGSYAFTLLADGPVATLVEADKANNQAEFSLPMAEVLYPDLLITGLSAVPAEGGYDLTATVKNQGDAACPAGLEVAFYADGRYVGAGKATESIAVGATAQLTFTWTQVTSAETLTAVANQGGKILELEQTNNTFTPDEGVSITAPARPTLRVTGVATAQALTFGQETTASVTVENAGGGNAGAFTLSLYLNGALVGSEECAGIAAGASDTVTVTWTPDQFPTGEMTLTAVADSAYRILMDSRDGVVMETPVTVGRGVLVTLRDPGTLTQNNQNDLAAEVTDSDYGRYTDGADVTFFLDGQPLGTGLYDESTGAYRLNADLTAAQLGPHTLRAVAVMTDEGGSFTGESSRGVTLAAPVGITLEVSEPLLAAGDPLTLSGTTQNAAEGAVVTLTLAGCGVYQYTTQVEDGAYRMELTLPADLGGTVTASASVTQSGITKTASRALSVYGAYVTLPGALTLTQGQAQAMTASAVNIGYTDLANLTLKAENLPDGFTVLFRGTGGAYEIPGDTGVAAARLERTENPVSVNGGEPEYAALDFGLQVAVDDHVEPGDYPLTFVFTGTTGEPNEGTPINRTLTVKVTVLQASANLKIDAGDKENPGSVVRSVRPGHTVTALVRAWNAGTGDLTDIRISAPNLPWVNLAIAGLGEGTTLEPYRSSAQRLSIQIVAAPTEKVEAGTYTGEVVISAKNNGTEVQQHIPVTFHVSAAQIGTAVLELWDEDSVPVSEGAKVSLYGPAEAAEPQLYDVTLDASGQVQLTNYPAGTYTLTFRHSGFEELEETFVLYPTIDLSPRRVTVERKQFQVTVSSGSFTDLEGVTGDNQAFYDIIYHLEVEPTNAAGLAFNYPADEFEASYSLGRVSSRISVRNSCLEGDGSEDETLHDVTFTLLSEDPDYEGLITFRGENGSVSSISRESLAPGAQLDLVWELAESALYVRAGVAEVEDSANTYTLTLPADCGLVWNGETGMFPTWNSENDNQYILTGVSGDGLVATVLAKTDAEGVTAPAPDSRVPKVQLVDQNGEYMSGGWYLDFTLAAKGMRRAGDGTEQPVARTIPLRVSYVSSGYYLASNSARTALDVRMEAAFPALSGTGYKYFSEGFLSEAQIGSSQVSGSGFSLGFSHTTVYENETQVLEVRFDNPSALEQITDLTFELMVSDLPPEDGLPAPGGSLQNAAFMVTPSIDGEAASVNPDGSITVSTVAAGEDVTASFLMTPTLELLDLTILDDFVENGLMTREEAQQAAQWLSSLNGDYYAWLNYSYTLDGETQSGSTPAVQQSAKPVAQLTSSYSLDAGQGNTWYLNAVITNTGSSEAEGVVLMTPSLPVVEGVTVHLLAGTWAFSGEAFPENWENTPYNGELEVGSIPGGATIRASYKLLVLDGTNGNAPISFLSGDSTAGGASTFSLLADSATRADPTPYEQYRQSLLSMVSQNGVSDANAYKSISVTTLSGDAQANPKELEQIILLLELLNAQPGDAQAEALIEQLAASNLSSEELRTLLESADTYGMEGLYAITEEKYAYALSDYLYAVSSLEHWDKQIANMDSWAGNASLAVSAVGLGVKLGGAGINAMTQAYKAGGNLSDIWSSAKKALLDEATSYVKDFNFFKNLKNYKKLQNLTEYWDYIKNAVKDLPDKVKGMVNLKPYKDLLELVQTVKAGSTAAAGLKGLDGMVESVRQLDRFLPPTTVTSPVLRSRNGVSVSTLLGDAKTRYETAARECETALKTYQDAMRNLKSTNVLLGSENQINDALKAANDARTTLDAKITVLSHYAAPNLMKKFSDINANRNFTKQQQAAIREYLLSFHRHVGDQVYRLQNATVTINGTVMSEKTMLNTVVKTVSASAKTMQEGRDALGTMLLTTGMVKDLAKGAYNSCVAIADGNWGQLILEAESAAMMLGTNGDGLTNGINGILLGWAGELVSQKNAEAAKNSAAGLLTVYQTVSNQVYETLYKGDTPHWPDTDECLTLATTFVEAMMGLQGDGEEAPSWIKLPADNEEAPYGADLADRLRTLAQANENVSVPKPTSKPDIFDDEMYQTILDFFTHAYVERLMVATTSGKAPSKILMDLDLPLDGWVNENVLINALTQTQSLMSLRENAAVTLDRGIGSTEALLKDDTLNATYPTAAMMAYLEELNAYILAAGDDGRSMSGLSPLPVYQKGIGKQVTGTLVNFYEYRKALAAQNASLSGIYDTTNDAINYNNVNNWFRAAMVTADSVSTILSFTSAAGFGQTLGNLSAGVSIGYDVYAFFWNNSHQKTAKNAVGVVQSQMPASMGSLTDLLTQQAQLTANTGELFGALAQWSKVDPQLPVKAISFSVSDAEAAPGQSTGAGQLRVAFLNSHSGPVQIHPAVLFVSRQGVLTEMPLDTMVVAAGESSEQTATFRIPISTLMDPGGYIALLTWSVSEGSTATVTRSSGPVTARFWAGEQALLSRMRDSGTERSVILASTACLEDRETLLTGKVQVPSGTGEVRFFLAAQGSSGAKLTVTGPDAGNTGSPTKLSILNEGDYWIFTAPEPGEYSVSATIPAGTFGQASIEALTLTDTGPVLDVHSGDALGMGKDLRGNTTSGTLEVYLAESGYQTGAGKVTFSLTNENGEPWSQPGLTWSLFGTDVGEEKFEPAGASELEAGGVLTATLLVEHEDAQTLTDGSYTAWLTITVNPADGEPLQPASSLWRGSYDGSVTYRKPVTIVVDRTPPAAPAQVSAKDQGDGTTLITGTALPGQMVGVALTTDTENIGQQPGVSILAGLTTADEATGTFSLTVATPAGGQSLVPFAASATGTLSLASPTEVEQPTGKTPVEISGLTVSNKTYDLKPVTVEGTPIVTGGYNPEQHGKLTYTWQKDDGRVLSEPPTDAGSYTLTVSVPEESPFIGSLILPFTIARADGTKDLNYSVPGSLTGTAGSALHTVHLPSGWSWNNPATTLKAGQNTCDATYTPASGNYEPVSQSLIVTATGGGGGSGGGGGGGGSLVPEEPGGETVTNPDGSTTTTETGSDGTVTEITTYPDGSTATAVTEPDGTATETTTLPDGTTGTARTDPEGNTTAQAEISPEAAEQAEQTGRPVELPLPGLVPGTDGSSAPTVEITLPDGIQSIVVEIPVEEPSPGVVAVLVNEDGTETVIKQSVAGENGLLLPLEGSAAIRLVDNTQTFLDVPATAWYFDAVTFVAARGILNGIGANRFDPDGLMTRGMQAQTLHNLAGNPASSLTEAFLDVAPGDWYADAVHWAAEMEIVLGYGNGLYGPDDNITREQFATILWRWAGEPESTHSLQHFTDADQISSYARTAMAWANEHGIVNGMGDNRLNPGGTALRSQAAQMLMNFCMSMAK